MGTITFVSPTSITVSVAATATVTSAGVLLWGNFVDTAITAAWNQAVKLCGTLNIADGVYFLQNVQFNTSSNQCKQGVGEAKTGVALAGQSSSTTQLILTPNLTANLASQCVNGGTGAGCFLTSPGINVKHIKFWGGGNSLAGTTHAVNLFELNSSNITTAGLDDVIFGGYGGGSSSMVGMQVFKTTPIPFRSVQVLGAGAINCEFSGGTGSGGQIQQLDCEDAKTNNILVSGTGAVLQSQGSVFGQTNNGGCDAEITGGTWLSNGDSFGFGNNFAAPTNTQALCVISGSQMYVNNGIITQGLTSSTSNAIQMGGSVAGSALWLSQSIVQGGTFNAFSFVGDSATIYDLGGNVLTGGFIMGAATAANANIVADGHSVKGACTGTATSASTLGLYGTGATVTATTCTSVIIGTGIPVNGIRKMYNLIVHVGTGGVSTSSGVVTVLDNGTPTTLTCTVGTGTACIDGTHTVTTADGDLISIQFTTQTAETLANVKATVEWN
jgi:cytoskeletal protein CcmA (bactofilin family)